MKCVVPILVVLAINAAAADLDEIRGTQERLTAARNNAKLPRDEVPLEEVVRAKRQLLFWAEGRLQSYSRNADPVALTKTLRKELTDVLKPGPGDDLDRLGDLDVAFSRPRGEASWLQMTTDVGIPCGEDQSVYLYEWTANRWNRRFALEAEDGSLAKYGPERSVELQISHADADGARIILATAYPPACMSVWHTLYIRLFQIGGGQKLLLERKPTANQGEEYSARLEPNGALIKFAGSSIDPLYLIRNYGSVSV